MRGQPPVLHRVWASTTSPPPRCCIGRRGGATGSSLLTSAAGEPAAGSGLLEGMSGCRCTVEVAARGVEADASPLEGREDGDGGPSAGGRRGRGARRGNGGAADEREEGGGRRCCRVWGVCGPAGPIRAFVAGRGEWGFGLCRALYY
jgi:hypothetical protein